MRQLYWIASAMMGATTCIHLFAGTPEIMTPVLTAPLDPMIKGVSLVVWHGITLILALMTGALAYLARNDNRALFAFVIAIQVGFAGLFLGVNILMLGSVMTMPQWILFTAISAVTLGAEISRRKARG